MIVLLERWSWKGHSLMRVGNTLLCTFTVQVFQETASSQYNSFTQKIVLKLSFIGYTGEDCYVHSLLGSAGRQELIEWIEIYLVYVLELAGHSMMTLFAETNLLLLCSPKTKLFTLVDYTSEMALKLHGSQWLHWGRLCKATVDSYHGLEMYVFVCNVQSTCFTGCNLIIAVENCPERKKMKCFI